MLPDKLPARQPCVAPGARGRIEQSLTLSQLPRCRRVCVCMQMFWWVHPCVLALGSRINTWNRASMQTSGFRSIWLWMYYLDVPWSCLCTQVDTFYMVKPNICWFVLHGRDCGIIIICYESITHEPECLKGGIRCRRGFVKQPWTR